MAIAGVFSGSMRLAMRAFNMFDACVLGKVVDLMRPTDLAH